LSCDISYFSLLNYFDADLQRSSQKKSKGRGITRMDEIFARTPNMPKIKITLNQYGQPVGKNSRKFSSVLGCQVRRKISVGCSDWRLVKPEKKYEVWTDIKVWTVSFSCDLILFFSRTLHQHIFILSIGCLEFLI
jgi:hypothetical protein